MLWAVMQLGQAFRGRSDSIEGHFMQVGAVFSVLSLFCNYPHFIVSYRLGYGRGPRFVLRHWFSLITVPLGLLALYALAYLRYDSDVAELPLVLACNHAFEALGLGFRLGTLPNLGTELLSLSILLMNLTVGWHYSKQVFGCVMVYARYDRYPISRLQRRLIKASLFSVAFLNFFYLSITATQGAAGVPERPYFANIPLIPLGLPSLLIPLSAAIAGGLGAAALYLVFYSNYRRHRRVPSLNLLIPWLAYLIWWIPCLRQNEFYLAAIPFFHSLQYLPFAYRIEAPRLARARRPEVLVSAGLALLIFAGFCAFELVPGLLDHGFETTWYLKTWFFMISFAVFINIHHFFIDSAIWKLDQKEVRASLLG